jgi:hypothetical protein
MCQGHKILRRFVGRDGGHYEVNLIQTEEPLGALRNVKMPEVDGIEGSAKYT